uniref:Uncharacterized protein n=1 Tax=Clytia hemisphaerica TaxID=252671 RepID=A0A7M5V308_9CNID
LHFRFDSVNNGEISKSFSSFKDQLNDDTRTSFKENPPRENSIDKLTHRYSPIVSARLRDLKVKQEQIMDILKSIAPAKLNGERDTNRITIADKATAPAIRTNNLARELVSTTPFSPRGYMEELEKKKNTREGLNPKQIKDLLALTKLAELTAMKKQGVSHPTQSVKNTKTDLHTRARELLKRPRIRTLLRFLVRSRKSKNLLRFLRTSYNDTLKRTGDITKRHELTEKYNKALHRLLELWSKRLPTPSSVLKAMDSSHSVERSDTPKRSDGKNVLERFG